MADSCLQVIGLFGQHAPGRPKGNTGFDSRATRLEWFRQGLVAIAKLPGLESLAFPDQIGCGLAGGDWPSFRAALEAFAADVAPAGVTVTLYRLPGATFDRASKLYTHSVLARHPRQSTGRGRAGR